MNKLTDYIRVFNDVVSPSMCQQIIDAYESNQSSVEEWDTELYKFHQLNLNHVDETKGLAMSFANLLIPCYETYFKSLGMRDFVEIDTFEDIRIKKYVKGSGDEFRNHVDVTTREDATRFCIAILYLNDNDGITRFPSLGVGVEPKVGRVVMFPPYWMFPHNGKAPTDNDKYIMMTSLHYK
jgi:hypothetical protein